MKRRIKALTLFLIGLCGTQAIAQSFVVQAGFGMAELKERGAGSLVMESDMKPGFHAGIWCDLPLNDWLSFTPGLLYSNKGSKVDQNILATKFEETLNLHYLDIPLAFKVSGSFENDMKVFGALGPYIGLGMAGKIKTVGGPSFLGSQNTPMRVSWGSSVMDDYKRVEIGATVGAGMEVKAFLVAVNYDYGISNISAVREDGVSSKNRVLRLTLGYRFGGR